MWIAFVGDSLTSGFPGCSYLEILRKKLPDHTLVNLGRGNDTSVSLYRRIAVRRIARLFLLRRFDLAFLWVGVNDVSRDAVWPVRVANTLRGQPRSRDAAEFRAYYERALDVLCQMSGHVVAVSPAIKGEDSANRWNIELSAMASVVEGLAEQYEQVSYLDVRTPLFEALDGRPPASYTPATSRVLWDMLTLWRGEQIDNKAAERGLALTLDGVHLNGRGAEIVAETFRGFIVGYA